MYVCKYRNQRHYKLPSSLDPSFPSITSLPFSSDPGARFLLTLLSFLISSPVAALRWEITPKTVCHFIYHPWLDISTLSVCIFKGPNSCPQKFFPPRYTTTPTTCLAPPRLQSSPAPPAGKYDSRPIYILSQTNLYILHDFLLSDISCSVVNSEVADMKPSVEMTWNNLVSYYQIYASTNTVLLTSADAGIQGGGCIKRK